MVLAVVAPCLGPTPQLSVSRCMPHHTPTYLAGLNQLTSPSLLGSLRLRIRLDSYSPPARSEICIVRQGVWNGACFSTPPVEVGDNTARNLPLSMRCSHMPE